MDTAASQAIHEQRTPLSSALPSPSSDADDALLILRARRGQGPKSDADAAFARIYDRHAAVVLALCRQHTATDTDADDALQETFLRAYRMLDRIDPSAATIRPWLYAIARNVCSEHRRSTNRRTAHEQTARELAMPALLDHNAASSAASNSADRAEQLSLLSRALDQLSESERLAVHLYYLDADPVAAATSTLGVSRSGYYKLLTRARERLAEIMRSSSPPPSAQEAPQ